MRWKNTKLIIRFCGRFTIKNRGAPILAKGDANAV